MKKLHLLIMIIFVSGCSAVTPEPGHTPTPANTVTPLPAINESDSALTPKATASPELDAYVNKIFHLLDDLSQTTGEMDQLFIIAKGRNNFTNEGWLKRANKNFDTLIEIADEIEAIQPVPSQAESAHEYLLLAAEEIRLVVSSQQEFIDGNIDGEESAYEHMQLLQAYVQKGLSELNKFQP